MWSKLVLLPHFQQFPDLGLPRFQFGKGACHTNEFCVVDPYEYYVVPAKCFALLAYRLLKDDAKLAKQIKADYTPVMTKESYIQLMDSLNKTESMPLSPAPVPDFYK